MLPLIFAAATGVAGFTGAWLYQGNHYERVIAEQRTAQAALLAEAHANAKRETERLQKAKDEALKAAAARQSALARDLAANRDALGRLSNAADSALRTADDSHSSCKLVAAAATDVFQQCSGRLVEVGKAADDWHSEAVTLREAWPSAPDLIQK